jgi:hypothetical protein
MRAISEKTNEISSPDLAGPREGQSGGSPCFTAAEPLRHRVALNGPARGPMRLSKKMESAIERIDLRPPCARSRGARRWDTPSSRIDRDLAYPKSTKSSRSCVRGRVIERRGKRAVHVHPPPGAFARRREESTQRAARCGR